MRLWYPWSGMTLASVGGLLSLGAMAGCEATIYPAGQPVVRQDVPPPPPPAGEVYVNEAPPPAPAHADVAIGVAPGPDFVWIGGHWWHDHGRWVWANGYWGRRPYGRAYWEPGRWDHRGHGYVWVDGHWR